MTDHLLDRLDAWLLLALLVAVLAVASDVGRRVARRELRRRQVSADDHKTLAGVVLGALLGLLGLLLAFSFSIVEGRLAARKRLVLEEANAIGTTYLRAGMLDAPHEQRVQRALERYLQGRIGLTRDELPRALAESAELHARMWDAAEAAAEARPGSPIVALFVDSLNDVIDLQEERLTVGLYQRLPPPFLWTLFLLATLTLGVLGYHVGLSGPRSRALLPTGVVVVSLTVVMMMVVEMDRPWGRMFTVSQQPFVDTLESMEGRAPTGDLSA
jgi:hypothetical protein